MKITICGSQTFCKEIEKAQKHLEDKGFQVFVPEFLITEQEYQKRYSREQLLVMKPIWTQNHFKKIQDSDAILVVNHEKKGTRGYIGSNTLMEVAVAFFLGKKIFMLNPIDEAHPHYEELVGIKSIVLEGDVDKFQ